MSERLEHWADPDGQQPMPFPAADEYARTVMRWAQEPLPPGVVALQGLPYGEDRLQRLDVYAPAGAANAPVLVSWHGGGWTNGYREYNRFMAPIVTRMGMVLVAPSYRLTPAHHMPETAADALAALAHVHRHAAEWGGNPQRLILTGHSAGGHLAALTALRAATRQAAGVPDSAIAACLPISGIMDLHHPGPVPGSLEARVYDTVLEPGQPHEDAVFSPLCWAAGNRLPVVLSWGSRDSERVRLSNQRLAAMLRLQSGSVATQCLEGVDHFGSHTGLRDPAHPWYQALAAHL